jgi:hypothetical protein
MSAGDNRTAEVGRPCWLRAMLPALASRVKRDAQKDAEDASDSPRAADRRGLNNRPEQVRALERANQVRRARALIKRRIAQGN